MGLLDGLRNQLTLKDRTDFYTVHISPLILNDRLKALERLITSSLLGRDNVYRKVYIKRNGVLEMPYLASH